jgi:2-amino-4-hydroxy-6-hydroxymethyldihydropteridine diphosphokinase
MSCIVFLALGSNLGDRENNLVKAYELLAAMEGFELLADSPLYLNPAVGMGEAAPDFLNMIVKGEYIYRPLELLNKVELIEKHLGRSGKGQKKPRPIDIDILLFGKEIIETDRLSIPHRKLTERAFFMVPLLQIDPEIVHPVTHEKISTYLNEKDKGKLIIYKEHIERYV